METIHISNLRPGDIVYRSLADFELFNHFGCYAGQDNFGRHWFFEHGKGGNARLTQFGEFSKGYKVKYKRIPDENRAGAIQRMRELLSDPKEYDAINFNCEHAAQFIATGKRESLQVIACLTLFAVGFLGLIAVSD